MSVSLGWCLSGQCDKCPTTVMLSDRNEPLTCACACHAKEGK